MDIVIPYSYDKHKGIELKYALRSIDKYLDGYGEIFIVGHNPRGFKNFTHVSFPDNPERKEYSIMSKMKWACGSPVVLDNFIMWHDDHFLLKPMHVRDFQYWTNGTLATAASRAKGGYLLSLKNTIRYGIKENFDIHTPIVFSKAQFLANVPMVFADGREYCVKSLYCRDAPGVSMSDCKINAPLAPDAIRRKIEGRLFFSTGPLALTNPMIEIFDYLYPDPSRYEN